MPDEQKPTQKKIQNPSAAFVVLGLCLITIAMINEGLLQLVLLAAAIVMLVAAVVLGRKKKTQGSE